MSDSATKHAHDMFERWPQLRDLSLNAITAELAAAEERGRRAGIEEAARLFDNCRDVMLAVELIPSRIRSLKLGGALAPHSSPDSGEEHVACGQCPPREVTERNADPDTLFSIRRGLAQRILAALEDCSTHDTEKRDAARDLRAAVERKP